MKGNLISSVVRTLFSFFVPGGLLLLGAVACVHAKIVAQSLPALMLIYPYAVFGAGMLLAWRFNKSRLVFALLVLALADRSLLLLVHRTIDSVRTDDLVFNAVALLLPINFAVFSLLKERGICTLHGILRLCLILLQALGIVLLCRRSPDLNIADYLGYSFVDLPALAGISLTQPALLVFFAVFLFFIVRFIIHRDAVVSAFFWTLVSVFIALAFEKLGPLSPVYFATGGLVLVISVIETSYSMAYHDELTGLPGRRSLNEALRKLTSRYAIAMVDIDHFKQFNDRYGHDVGDQVLRMVGSKLVRTTGGARAFRYGGEEFILVFHESLMDVIPHLERLRKTIGTSEFMLRGSRRPRKKPKQPQTTEVPQNGVSVTVSIGLAERDDNYRTPEEVVRAADKALYRAKNSGRNRVST
ncbi:MAG: hypothetical protein BAW33_03585 [Desulfobacterales bacterium C00003104]|nr:MAG: hypothetical protein BAW33_03585 [Desulfobacterales bacterium C00003104]